jgi:L-seryl-tRNA(Ser) seleniumtransferase
MAARQAARAGDGTSAEPEAAKLARPGLARAVNMSGTVLHTGLGRAPLAPLARQAVAEAAGACVLEFGLEDGGRGDRQDAVRAMLCELTGAEDALVVNNCAAAVTLALAALGPGRRVLLSRGEMVEIGGSFRLPEVVEQSGCVLAEVGCTNKTRLSDYERAWDEETAAILRCHPSNYRIVGFHAAPQVSELAGLAHAKGGLLVDDVGSGCLVDTSAFGLERVPTLRDSVAAGADVVVSSADKLMGGPQAGVAVGRAAAVAAMRSHPLARAFRADKLALAGLRATLWLYLSGREREIPVWGCLGKPLGEVRRDAARLVRASAVPAGLARAETAVGGGSLPGQTVPTWVCALDSGDAGALAARLRSLDPPIVGYVRDGRVCLDPRTCDPADVRYACTALSGL